jgi:glutathione S-transferase
VDRLLFVLSAQMKSSHTDSPNVLSASMSRDKVTIIGSYLSPYVRKVLACLEIRQVRYEIDPIVPYFGNEEFSALSPLRRIPVLIDSEVTLCDSTVICEYINEAYPGPPLLPATPALRARSRWLEEYADTRMGDVFIWNFYNQLVIRKKVWRREPDPDVLDAAVNEEIPGVLDYLEGVLPSEGWLFDDIAVADIAIASFFRNAQFAGFEFDTVRWPRTSTFVGRALAHPALAVLQVYEDLIMTTPIPERRQALLAAGAPLTPKTIAGHEPRKGFFYI